MWPFKAIANADLAEEDLPSFHAEWDAALNQFAGSFDGYEFFAHASGPDNRSPMRRLNNFAKCARQAYFEEHRLPTSLNELRACLFAEQRRWHWLGSAAGSYELYNAEGRVMEYIHALLDAIAKKVRAGERE
jgi:hypothetical protein